MDGVVLLGLTCRSIPAVLDDNSKMYALSNQSFLSMNSGRIGTIDAGALVPSNATC
jgi:hypothetical protein